jgi:hypothetical protein
VSSDPAPNAVVAPNTPNISQNISQESNESQQNTGQVFAKSDVVSFGGIDGDKKIAVKSGGVIRLGGSGNKNNDLSV